MAPPTSFNNAYGVALMRRSPSTGEWWFVDWVRGSADFALDSPGPGTWIYALWVVVGAAAVGPNSEGIISVIYNGRARLLVENLKR